jgi:hypothetical protein
MSITARITPQLTLPAPPDPLLAVGDGAYALHAIVEVGLGEFRGLVWRHIRREHDGALRFPFDQQRTG